MSDSGAPASADDIQLVLAGDVMLGRGIDQIFATHNSPVLDEPHARSALHYLALAERASGAFTYPVAPDYVWGDALPCLAQAPPDLCIVNLETAITVADRPAHKHVNYRMHPANIGTLSALGVDCCVLANNHVLDWGMDGLLETLDHCAEAGVATAGAGRSLSEAMAPATLSVPGRARVRVFSLALPTSGVRSSWAAGANQPGIAWLADLSPERTTNYIAHIKRWSTPGDLIVVCVHWGPNWGYKVTETQRRFAHALIERAGVQVVCGHSSHHPKAIERYQGRAILYGCGDLINDYEGLEGHQAYRPDLVLLYRLSIAADAARPADISAWPFRIHRFRLQAASADEAEWLRRHLDRECAHFGARLIQRDQRLVLTSGDTPG
ncbi:CapA family protein [Salinisphaera sp. SPP-AMP-43]|uniref:CapA family protein n=1 Tax=Salinisphaera sp. SPP-AMP-43 TaxID=3121288 RepID=UPI003C6E2FFE